MKRLLTLAALVCAVACNDELPTSSEPDDLAGRWIGTTGGLSLALIVDAARADDTYEGQAFLFGNYASEWYDFSASIDGDSLFLTGADITAEGAVLEAGRQIVVTLDAPPFNNLRFTLGRPQ